MTSTFRPPKLLFSRKLPPPARFGKEALLLHDSALSGAVAGFRDWASAFPATQPVEAGETLKDLDHFPARMKAILAQVRNFSPAGTTLVVAGGGSVGDFGGFVASVLKRGVRLVHFPSTWLSAIDSAHGGKTALNVAGVKNQIGTFYPASEVHLVRELLSGQGPERLLDAEGELAKIALIDGGPWTRKLGRGDSRADSTAHSVERMWSALKPAIAAKYKIVSRDPFEKKELRKLLNLGHTMGHAIEAHYGLPHGRAVAQGLLFAARFSEEKRLLKGRDAARVREFIERDFGILPMTGEPDFQPIPEEALSRLLADDKKRAKLRGPAPGVGFVFLSGFGKASLKTISLDSLLGEARRQGWMR